MSEMDDRVLTPRVRVMQIIALALITGVLVFLGVASFQAFVQRDGQLLRPANELPILLIVATVMLIGGAGMSLVMPLVMTRGALRQLAAVSPKSQGADIATLLNVYQTTLIVGMAFLEGPAFTGCVSVLIDASHAALGLVGIAIVGLLLNFPTAGRVRAWLADKTNQLDHMRSGGEPSINPR